MTNKEKMEPVIQKFMAWTRNMTGFTENHIKSVEEFLRSDKFLEDGLKLQDTCKSQKELNIEVTNLVAAKFFEILPEVFHKEDLNKMLVTKEINEIP